MIDLSTAWQEIEVDVGSGTGFVQLRVSDAREPAVYAGRRRRDGREAILLEVDTQRLPRAMELPRADGLEISSIPIRPGPSGRTSIQLTLGDSDYFDIFVTLAGDVVDRVVRTTNDGDAVIEFIARIERWQQFLRRYGPGGLSMDAKVGLFGALWVLQRLLAVDLPKAHVVHGWRGPEHDAHDFQFPTGSLEVKATRSATPKVLHISNAKQLDDRGLVSLYVCLVQVEEGVGAELTLPDLVERIRSQLSGQLLELLEDRLLDVGYTDKQFADRPREGYAVRRERWFGVREGFPRLLESDLPTGVVDISYSVQLAACAAHELDGDSVIVTLAEGLK